MNNPNIPPHDYDPIPRGQSTQTPGEHRRPPDPSPGAGGWIAAGIVAALLVVGALWLTADPAGENTMAEQPAPADQTTTVPGQTDNAPTGSVTPDPVEPATPDTQDRPATPEPGGQGQVNPDPAAPAPQQSEPQTLPQPAN